MQAGCFGEAREGIAAVGRKGQSVTKDERGQRGWQKEKDDRAGFHESRLAGAICLAIAINSSHVSAQ